MSLSLSPPSSGRMPALLGCCCPGGEGFRVVGVGVRHARGVVVICGDVGMGVTYYLFAPSG